MIHVMTDVEGGTFYIQFEYNPRIIAIVKTIDGRKWNPDLKLWHVPASPAYASMIDDRLRNQQYTADEAFHSMLARHEQGKVAGVGEPTYRETYTPCFRHQLVGLDLTISRKTVYLAWMMGVGKSKTVVDTAGLLKMQRVLILCPKSVVMEWPRQFLVHGLSYGIRCVPLVRKSVAHRTKVAAKALTLGPAAIVINYEAAWLAPFGDWALAQDWDLVVCDEAHRGKDPKARISKFMHKLAERADRRICLSGTPIPNNPLDLWSQCRFLDVGIFGNSFYAFKARYAVLGGFKTKQVLGFRNLDELNRRFYEVAHRVTKAECLDLPPEMDETREVDLGPEGAKHYRAMEGQFYAQVENGSITIENVLVEALRLQQCTGGAVQYDQDDRITEVDTSKATALADLFSDLPDAEPVVVFCRFHHDLDVVARVAADCGRRSFELSGRKNELAAWREGKGVETILAVQIQAGGLGIDLTKSCYCIFYSLGFSLGEYEQARARLHRQGQTRAVTYYHLIATVDEKPTIDTKVYKALARKEKVAGKILRRD